MVKLQGRRMFFKVSKVLEGAKLSGEEFESLKEQPPFKGILGNPGDGEVVSEEPVSNNKTFKEILENLIPGGGEVASEEPRKKYVTNWIWMRLQNLVK